MKTTGTPYHVFRTSAAFTAQYASFGFGRGASVHTDGLLWL